MMPRRSPGTTTSTTARRTSSPKRSKAPKRPPVPRRDRTIARILTLLRDASSGHALRVSDAQARYGASERTIYRDIRTLRRLGIGLSLDDESADPRHRTYRLDNQQVLPTSRLSLDEALPLALAGRHLFGERQIPLLESAKGGIARVLDGVSKPVEHDLSKLERRISVRLAARNPARGFSDTFRVVVDAMLRNRVLDASYKSAYDLSPAPPQRFRVEPFALLFRHRAWYLLGRRVDQGRVKLYKLVRFRSLMFTGAHFAFPSHFDVERHFGQAWAVMRGTPRARVEIDFTPDFAVNIADTEWHATQTITMRDDGSMRFTCHVDGLDEIVWWVLSMGAHARVIRPKALALRVAREAAAAAALYAVPGRPITAPARNSRTPAAPVARRPSAPVNRRTIPGTRP